MSINTLPAHCSEQNFSQLLAQKNLVMVDAYATWCEPCKMLDEILVELDTRMKGSIEILKFDVDEQTALAEAFGIRSVPTLMVFRKGELCWRMAGFKLAHELQAELERIAAGT
ncbi:MAG: thioredoxin domain-containing protein [Sphingobacteriales bacterium]|jgi:thioredoxin 1|nr:thioredoxin domain-containing protein [Sphingobacteriales bacterium]